MEKKPGHPYRISQIAVVVKDIDARSKTYHELFGWGPWNVYEHVPPKLHDTHLHGKPADFSMLGAECEVQPGLVFELVQPLDGDSIYKEHLDEHGEGVQHLALMSHTPRGVGRVQGALHRGSGSRSLRWAAGSARRSSSTTSTRYAAMHFVAGVRLGPRHRSSPPFVSTRPLT